MNIQLIERWEGAVKQAKYQIEVERIETRPGHELFNIRLTCDARIYETKVVRTRSAARARVQHAISWGIAFGSATYKRTYRDPSYRLGPATRGSPDGDLTNRFEVAAKLGMFLVSRKGTCLGQWRGRLSAQEQRTLFGRFLGKGELTIDGTNERIRHSVSRCFGLDYEITADIAWRDL